MKRNKPLMFLLISVLLLLISTTAAAAVDSNYIVNVYFFNGDGCPHCAEEKPFLADLAEEFGENLVIHDYELWNHPNNLPIVEEFADAYGFLPSGVPITFIGHQYWVGFSAETRAAIDTAIRDGVDQGVVDAQDIVNGLTELVPPTKPISYVVDVPLIGEVDLQNQSLLLSTVVIGLVDGVNPCSLWVLTMLIAMIVHTNSRKKMLIIGFVYLSVTALIYALFIAGVFSLLNYASYMQWIQIAVACITLVLGLINLKDYFFFKEGVSLTIDDAKKPGLYQKMRNVINSSENFWTMIGATVILAAGVSLVEFSCTAAFPVVWSNLLVNHVASRTTFILLLILYMVLYQLDELIIFLIAVFTMRATRMEEKHGQMLKLFSGCLMVILSVVLIFNPSLMNDLGNSLLVFAAAILITAGIIIITASILPHFGIYIGHNRKPTAKKKHK